MRSWELKERIEKSNYGRYYSGFFVTAKLPGNSDETDVGGE